MHRHNASRLQGPVSRARGWWTGWTPEVPVAGGALLADRGAMDMNDCFGDEHLDHCDIRADLVERVRREIEAGTYDTPEKWDAALDRLLDRLQEDK
jgi:negative regulator of flagellin synthesis FlgM